MFFRQKKSISISTNGDLIYIHHDERFVGQDVCHHCRFSPCKVKRWFGGKNIEDCKLYNRMDPDTLGSIKDCR
jgi:hypothetical protein